MCVCNRWNKLEQRLCGTAARAGSAREGSTHLKSRARRDGVEELLSQSIVVVVDRQLEQVHACSRRRQQCVVGVRSRNRKLGVEVLEAEKRALSTENSKSTPRQQAGEQDLCARVCTYVGRACDELEKVSLLGRRERIQCLPKESDRIVGLAVALVYRVRPQILQVDGTLNARDQVLQLMLGVSDEVVVVVALDRAQRIGTVYSRLDLVPR